MLRSAAAPNPQGRNRMKHPTTQTQLTGPQRARPAKLSSPNTLLTTVIPPEKIRLFWD
jgi:hypothetical protein